MAIRVRVIRTPGDNVAPDIVDPLCTTESVAIERGRVFIDSNYRNKIAVDGRGPFVEWLTPGSMLDVVDNEFSSYSSMVIATSISFQRSDDSYTADTILKLERLDDQ